MLTLNNYIHQAIIRIPATDDKSAIETTLLFTNKEYSITFDAYNERIKLYGVPAKSIKQTCSSPIKFDKNPELPFSKIIVYAPPGDEAVWESMGFIHEGDILGFFQDHSQTSIWSFFLDPQRQFNPEKDKQDAIVTSYSDLAKTHNTINSDYKSTLATEKDGDELSVLLQQIFPDYPSSLSSQVIKTNIKNQSSIFRYYRNDTNKIIAIASAEINSIFQTAELTDCATLEAYRGQGLIVSLLEQLMLDLQTHHSIRDFYTLCRSTIPGINIAFSKLNFKYQGRLINNCKMPSGWESMNIWTKSIF